MKGAIFKLLEDFVVANHGPDAFEDLLDRTELQTTRAIVGPGTYPAEDLIALVETAVATYGQPIDELLRAFGRHSFPPLAESVSDLMVGLDDPISFLLNLESVIHTEVRKLDPEANPARFTATDLGDGQLRFDYQSDLGLFPLVEGFLDGVGDWFETPLIHERVSTDGTNAVFRVRASEKPIGSGPVAEGAPDGVTV